MMPMRKYSTKLEKRRASTKELRVKPADGQTPFHCAQIKEMMVHRRSNDFHNLTGLNRGAQP